MTSLILPDYARAPLFVPGRRNRKVHWNRALSKAIESLGTFEREDWRRAKWLPKSLRGFYPKWFASKNKAGCGCCSESDPCGDCEDCQGGTSPTECEVDVPAFTNADGDCTNCGIIAGTYILTKPVSPACLWRYQDTDSGICTALTLFSVSIQFLCLDSKCAVQGQVIVNRAAFEIQASYYNMGSITQTTPVNLYTYANLPWSLPYVGEGLPSPTHVNCTPDGNDLIVQSFA